MACAFSDFQWEFCILIQFIAARYWFSEDSSSSVNERAASWGISPLEFLKMSGYIKNVFCTQAHRWLYIRETFQLFTTFYFTDSEEPTSAIEPLSQHLTSRFYSHCTEKEPIKELFILWISCNMKNKAIKTFTSFLFKRIKVQV